MAAETATTPSAPSSSGPRCWLVRRDAGGSVEAGVRPLPWDPATAPEPDAAAIRVEAAGFNYKDALACSGHPGVMRVSPLVPGIDVAGSLLAPAAGLPAGAPVLVTAHHLGEGRHGGFATEARVPVTGLLARPEGLSAEAAMALGTAGLTTVLACDTLDRLVHRAAPTASEEWLVTGASGGVGMIAVAWLAAAGRRVVACSRKPQARELLLALGASAVEPPAAVVAAPGKSLARGRWAGVVDTVGGGLLADVLRSVRHGGAVTAVGMAGGVDLHTTVHPFILRGVTLAGIDTAATPTRDERIALWRRLAEFWPRLRSSFPVTRIGLDGVGDWADAMLRGGTVGRAVVVP